MTEVDPLQAALRADDAPVTPDSNWAARLRDSVERALFDQEVDMSTLTTNPVVVTAALTPYLAVSDARTAIDWYAATFGAQLVDELIVMPDGRVGHAELSIGGARLYLSDANPEIGVVAPVPDAGAAVTLHLELDDVDAVFTGAVEHDAVIERAPATTPYGRQVVLRDPFGHRWMVMSTESAASPATVEDGEPMRDGDLAYFSIQIGDIEQAFGFYQATLGWRSETRRRGSIVIDGQSINQSIYPSADQHGIFCCYGVHDLEAALTRVVIAGGVAAAPVDSDHGRTADCIDTAGLKFALWQIQPGAMRPPTHGSAPGDLGYLTMESPDLAATKTFYGAVLGWIEDDGGDPGVAPMTGLSPDPSPAVNVACWLVRDIDDAVLRVRAAGGEAEDPVDRPYGRLALCADDQGLKFWLGDF